MHSPEAIAALLSWAVRLSPYPAPAQPPAVYFASRALITEKACGGRHCGAIAWYDNHGGIYIDERYHAEDTPFARSLVVHEMVHYLQDLSGRFDPASCADHRRREYEAHALQREYIAQAFGQVAYLRMALWEC